MTGKVTNEAGDALLLLAIPAAVLEPPGQREKAILERRSTLGVLPGRLTLSVSRDWGS